MTSRPLHAVLVAVLLLLAGCNAFATAETPTASPTPISAATPAGSSDSGTEELPVVESVATSGGTCERPPTATEFRLVHGGTDETRLHVVGNVRVDDASAVVDDLRIERTDAGVYELLVTTALDPEKPSQPCAGSVGYDASVRIPEGMHDYTLMVRHDGATAGGFGKYDDGRATPQPAA